MNAPTNGTPEPQPLALPVPEVEILYRAIPGGQVVVGITLAGQRVGGIVAKADLTMAGGRFMPMVNPPVQVFELAVVGWPVKFRDVTEPDVIAATQMPPEPPKGPRIFRG